MQKYMQKEKRNYYRTNRNLRFKPKTKKKIKFKTKQRKIISIN